MNDLRQEKAQRERLAREKEIAIAEKFTVEQNLSVSTLFFLLTVSLVFPSRQLECNIVYPRTSLPLGCETGDRAEGRAASHADPRIGGAHFRR